MKFSTHPQLVTLFFRAPILCALAVFFLLAGNSTTSYGQYYYEDWDEGNSFYWRVEGASSVAVSDRESLSGRYSFRSYVPAQHSNNPRHEIVFKGTNLPNEFELYKDYTIQYAMYVPSNFKPDPEHRDVIMQIMSRPDKNDTYGDSHFSISLDGYDVNALTRWVRRDPGRESDITRKSYSNVAKVERGKWHYFTIEFRMDPRSGGNGFIRVFMRKGGWPTNSHKIVDYRGGLGSKDERGPYAKLGVYKWWWREKSAVETAKRNNINYRELYYDNIKIQKGLIINGPGINGPTADYSISGSSLFTAGPDFTVNVSEGKFLLTAGWASSYNLSSLRWSKVSGPGSTESYKGNQYEVRNIRVGKYVFEAQANDTRNRRQTDRVVVTVTDGKSSGSGSSSDDSSSGGSTGGTTTASGIVDAGNDFSINVSKGNFLLDPLFGAGIKPEKLRWTKKSGPDASGSYEGYEYRVRNIKVGTYVYEIRIEYSGGKVATDQIAITVTDGNTSSGGSTDDSGSGGSSGSSGGTASGIVDAGNDFSVNVAAGNFLLDPLFGAGIRPEKLRWSKVSGPSFSGSYEGYEYRVRNIQVGTYVFEIRIEHSGGKVATDRISVRVTDGQTSGGSTPSSGSLSVNAGPNQTVSLSAKKFVLEPSFDKSSVDVAGLRWFKISGPSFSGRYLGYSYEVSSIKVGSYVFEVRLTDAKGNVATDRVRVDVKSSSSAASSSDEFSDFVGEENAIEYGVTKNYISAGEPLVLIKGNRVQSEVQILSVTGQPIQAGYQNGLLETDRLSPGLYIYNLMDGEGQLIQKGRIIKK